MGLTRPEKWARDVEDRRKQLEYRELMRKREVERKLQITTMAMLLGATWVGSYFHKYVVDDNRQVISAQRWNIEGHEITSEQAEELDRRKRLLDGCS